MDFPLLGGFKRPVQMPAKWYFKPLSHAIRNVETVKGAISIVHLSIVICHCSDNEKWKMEIETWKISDVPAAR
jgi:hypothetical protein